jgi:hypothetical protein
MRTQAGTWIHFKAQAISPDVADRIIHNSQTANAAAATAVKANARFAHAFLCRHQIRTCNEARVRHAEAVMDQMTVTQLM